MELGHFNHSVTTPLDYRNTNALWCSVLVETLHRLGVGHAVVSPGSRSTPLTMALARHAAIVTTPVLDERSAAFFALGIAKQTRRATLLVCTSGSAGANYLPAVIEAAESAVPLLVVTADRPPEMRGCASGQTIDQQKLFGDYARWYHELAVPEARVDLLRYLRQTLVQAVERTLGPDGGPVHLNAPFRDPLPPVDDGGEARLLEAELGDDFFAHVSPPAAQVSAMTTWQRPTTARGLIIAGTDAPADVRRYVAAVWKLARALGWPVLADVLSPVRHWAPEGAPVITAYDAILRDTPNARELTPRTVLCLGTWPTSKVLRQWLEASGAEVTLVTPRSDNRDALHGRTRHLRVPVETLAAAEGGPPADEAWLGAWRRAEDGARAALWVTAREAGGVFEGDVTFTLAKSLPPAAALYVASSMPVRDVEYFWPAGDKGTRFFFGRGANGIDGTLSTALGVAQGAGQPVVLLTGDLALLHDSNGFLVRPHLRGSLTVVLINNAGGGIFEHLPVAQFEPPFERFWATPQQVDFAKLCAAHGVEHVPIENLGQLGELVRALPTEGVRVLEVRTDRKRDAARRKRIFAAAAVAARVAREAG